MKTTSRLVCILLYLSKNISLFPHRTLMTLIMAGTKVLPVTTTGHTWNQAHTAAPLHHPDRDPKIKRVSRNPTAHPKTSAQLPAATNSLWGDLLLAPTLDQCLGHVLVPDPGLDASLVATNCCKKAFCSAFF